MQTKISLKMFLCWDTRQQHDDITEAKFPTNVSTNRVISPEHAVISRS